MYVLSPQHDIYYQNKSAFVFDYSNLDSSDTDSFLDSRFPFQHLLDSNSDFYYMEKTADNDYYIRNKSRLAQAAKTYRQTHKHELSKKAKKYRMKVQMGMHRPQQRLRQGNSYTFIRR